MLEMYWADMEKVIIPEDSEHFGGPAYPSEEIITELVLSDSVTGIGEIAFSVCKNLEKEKLHNG